MSCLQFFHTHLCWVSAPLGVKWLQLWGGGSRYLWSFFYPEPPAEGRGQKSVDEESWMVYTNHVEQSVSKPMAVWTPLKRNPIISWHQWQFYKFIKCSSRKDAWCIPLENMTQGNKAQGKGQSYEEILGLRSVWVCQLLHVFPGHTRRKPVLLFPEVRQQIHFFWGQT